MDYPLPPAEQDGFPELAEGPGAVPPPPPPAADRTERLARLRLARSPRIGPVTWRRLLAEHGSATAALEALPQRAAKAGRKDWHPASEAVARAEARAAGRLGARLLTLGDRDYPPALAELPNAPPVLWLIGDATLLARPAVAIVGARGASAASRRLAALMARRLAEAGLAVVSGLARGIDAEAHRGALGGGTVAVLPGGLARIYPPEHEALAREIATKGLLLSEHPPEEAPLGRHFPARNRIVAGLARAVVVVEAAHRSGSLITARLALDAGREVMAVPGHPLDPRSAGVNALIRDGAPLVRSAEDVLETMAAAGLLADVVPPASASASTTRAGVPTAEPLAGGPPPAGGDRAPARTDHPPPGSDSLEAGLRELLSPTPVDCDSLARRTGRPAAEVLRALTLLEMRGEARRLPDGRVIAPP